MTRVGLSSSLKDRTVYKWGLIKLKRTGSHSILCRQFRNTTTHPPLPQYNPAQCLSALQSPSGPAPIRVQHATGIFSWVCSLCSF
jgi:hypothetical protein